MYIVVEVGFGCQIYVLFRVSEAKSSSWIDVNREVKRHPGTFQSRNVGLDRFFDTQRRHDRSAAREQWTRRSVLSDRSRSSEGMFYGCDYIFVGAV